MDANNWFKLETPSFTRGDPANVIQHNDVVRLKHLLTGKYLTVYNGTECVTNEHASLVSMFFLNLL